MPLPAADLDALHDPGASGAMQRADATGDVGADPISIRGHEVRVGTASWTDPTMTAAGVFYPQGADSAEERLQFCASQFPLVEVDATYYALPVPRMAELWRGRDPARLHLRREGPCTADGPTVGDETAARGHPGRPARGTCREPLLYAGDLPAELSDEIWRLFREGLKPLRAAGQLGAILVQHPRWVFPSSENRDAILEARSPRQLVQQEER